MIEDDSDDVELFIRARRRRGLVALAITGVTDDECQQALVDLESVKDAPWAMQSHLKADLLLDLVARHVDVEQVLEAGRQAR